MRQYRFDGSFITIADLMIAANTELCAHRNKLGDNQYGA